MDKTQTCSEPLQAEPQTRTPAITPPQKRQIDGDIDELRSKRARLTRKNLALFNHMGKTKTTSTTTSGFAIQTYENGILPPRRSKPPTNLKDIQERHIKSRDTASPTESAFRHYTGKVGRAPNEATIVVESSTALLKDYNDEGYHRSFNQSFTGFAKEVGFNDGLSAPQPDYIEGLEMEEFSPFPIRKKVDGTVLYGDDPDSLALPHLAGEYKGRGKNLEDARLQSAYDGAALVYARNQALSHIGKIDPLGHAEVITFTTDGTTLNQYAHYAKESEDGAIQYHQYQYASTNVKDSYQGHKDGRKGLRNAQDHARNQSYALKDNLKEYWKQHRSDLKPIAEGTLPVANSQANPLEDINPYNTGTSTRGETNSYQTGYDTSARDKTIPYQTDCGTSANGETDPHKNVAGDKVVAQPHLKHRSSSRHSSKHSAEHSSPKHTSTKYSASEHSPSESSHHAPRSDGHKRKASQLPPLRSGHASKHSDTDRDCREQDPNG
jgi:hypothetical protein